MTTSEPAPLTPAEVKELQEKARAVLEQPLTEFIDELMKDCPCVIPATKDSHSKK